MALKTLKDLQKEYEWKYDTYKALKAEAVKWVKMLQQRIDKGIASDFKRSEIEWRAQIRILRIVFNLTEEDLK